MTGSERAKQRRQDFLLAFSISSLSIDLAYCADCPCEGNGAITREGVVSRFKCSVFQAERALAVLQRSGFLDASERGGLSHGGRHRWPVLDFRGCRDWHAAYEIVLADKVQQSRSLERLRTR